MKTCYPKKKLNKLGACVGDAVGTLFWIQNFLIHKPKNKHIVFCFRKNTHKIDSKYKKKAYNCSKKNSHLGVLHYILNLHKQLYLLLNAHLRKQNYLVLFD